MATPENRLIALLPSKDRARLHAVSQQVELKLGQVLSEPGKPARHVYFPVEGFVSLIATSKGTAGVEVGMVGREGMLGVQLALGVVDAPLHGLVQGDGAAWRIPSSAFGQQLKASEALQRGLHQYLYVLMTQLATSAACLRFHLIGNRLARWLLMTQDRSHAKTFRVTHEFLAFMLGVRRVSVTNACGSLHRRGLIEYHRGNFTVLDRRGLEAAACSCYAADKKAYRRLTH